MSNKVKVKLYHDTFRYKFIEVNKNEVKAVKKANAFLWRQIKQEVRNKKIIEEANIKICSLDKYQELGDSIKDESVASPEIMYIEKEEKANKKRLVLSAIQKLTPRQKEMVYLVFFKGVTQNELAEKYGVTKAAISNSMQRIYATLEKIIKSNEDFSL